MKFTVLLAFLLLVAADGHAAEEEARARNLLNSLGCKGCHSFEGSGGSIGPGFDAIGARYSAAQIRDRLLSHGQANPGALMPDYSQFDPDTLEPLVRYLAARK